MYPQLLHIFIQLINNISNKTSAFKSLGRQEKQQNIFFQELIFQESVEIHAAS